MLNNAQYLSIMPRCTNTQVSARVHLYLNVSLQCIWTGAPCSLLFIDLTTAVSLCVSRDVSHEVVSLPPGHQPAQPVLRGPGDTGGEQPRALHGHPAAGHVQRRRHDTHPPQTGGRRRDGGGKRWSLRETRENISQYTMRSKI